MAIIGGKKKNKGGSCLTESEGIYKVNGSAQNESNVPKICFRCIFYKPLRKSLGFCRAKKDYVSFLDNGCDKFQEKMGDKSALIPVVCGSCNYVICEIPFAYWNKYMAYLIGKRCPNCGHLIQKYHWEFGGKKIGE